MLMCIESVGSRDLGVSWSTMESCERTMFSLVDSSVMSRIENNLLVRRNEFIQATSWTMNVIVLAVVIVGFASFLYIQYTTTAAEEVVEKHIPFEPIPWLSATRNVRTEEYGRQLKPYEVEAGNGVPGPIDGFSGADVR